MGNCLRNTLIPTSTFSISVSAVTVDKTTLQDVSGQLTTDSDKFIFVQVTISYDGANPPAVKGGMIRLTRTSDTTASFVCHPCSASRVISQSASYPLAHEFIDLRHCYSADLPAARIAGIVGTFYFAIVDPVLGRATTFSAASFRLRSFGFEPRDAGLLGLRSPALADLPCPFGSASVELLGGNFSLRIPLFEERKGAVSIPLALTYRSPRKEGSSEEGATSSAGASWRLSIEHDLNQHGDGYRYTDGEGLIHSFKPALTQKDGMQVYYDVAGTHAVLIVIDGSRKIYWPSGVSVSFDSSGKGIRVAMRRTATLEDAYDIEYSSGKPSSVKVGGETRVSFTHSVPFEMTITSEMYGAWTVATSLYGPSSVVDPAGRTVAFGYVWLGPTMLDRIRVLGSVAYKGKTMSVSRFADGAVSSANLTEGTVSEEMVSFLYGVMRTEMTRTPLGRTAAAKTTGFDFDENGECIAEYEVDSNVIRGAVGHAFYDSASGEMENGGSAPQWESAQGLVFDSSAPATENVAIPQGGFCPGSFLYIPLSADRFESGFVPFVSVIVKLKNSSGGVLLSRTLKYIGGDQRPWFIPIPNSALASVASIEMSTGTPHFEVTADAIEIRRLRQGFEQRGCDLDLLPGAGSGTLIAFNRLTARIALGGTTQNVAPPPDYSSMLDSILISSVVPSGLQVLFASQGAYVGDQASVALYASAGLFWVLDRVNVKTSREIYLPSSSGQGFEKARMKRSMFGRTVLGGDKFFATEFEAFYCGSETAVRTKETKVTYEDWMRETRSSSAGIGSQASYYDSARRLVKKTSTVRNPDPDEPDKTTLIKKIAYDSDGNIESELISNGDSLYGTSYSYDTSGKLADTVPPGMGCYYHHYLGQAADGVDYSSSTLAATDISSRIEEGASFGSSSLVLREGIPPLEAARISLSETVSAGSLSTECSYGDYFLEMLTAYALDGNSSTSTTAGQSEIENASFNVDGRVVSRFYGGEQVYAAAYHQWGWKRGKASSFGPPGNGQIAVDYDAEGRVSSLARGTATATYEYSVGADSSDNRWFEKVVTNYSNCNSALVSEQNERVYSDTYPSGYATTVCVLHRSYTRSTAVTVSGGAFPSRRYFCNGPALDFREIVTYKDDACSESGADTTLLPSSSIFYKASSGPVLTLTQNYWYDDCGRIKSKVDRMVREPTEALLSTDSVERDPETGAICSERIKVGNLPEQCKTFEFDSSGNVRLIRVESSGVVLSYAYDYQNGMLYSEEDAAGTTYFSFDDAGRMTQRRGQTVTWSGWQITGIDGLGTLQYSPDGLVGEQKNLEQGHIIRYALNYLFGKLTAETVYYDSTPKIVLDYFYGGDGLVAGFFASYPVDLIDLKGPFFFRRNALGDVLSIVGPDGPVAHYAYGAFGESYVLDADGQADSDPFSIGNANPFRYRGMRYYRTLGVYQMGARVYDPSLMRFLTPDLPEYLDPMVRYGLNPYCYCHNDPLMYVDPTGNMPLGIAILLFLGLSAVGGFVLQVAFSAVSYIGMAVASLWDEEVRADMNEIRWNPFNANPAKVIKSNKVSFYNGIPVFRTPFGRSFTFFGIFLEPKPTFSKVRHEFGHIFQQLILGIVPYLLWVMIPSAGQWGVEVGVDDKKYNESYYHRPWEVVASFVGGDTDWTYSEHDLFGAFLHLFVAKYLGPFSYLFGFWR